MERYEINRLVMPGFPGLFEAFYIQEELTKLYAPRVFEALVGKTRERRENAKRAFVASIGGNCR
jgi:hypothetical protein